MAKGGKYKRIEKEDKPARAARISESPLPSPKKSFANDHEVFSEPFKQKVVQYLKVTNEVLTLKGTVESTNESAEITRRREVLSERVEQAATQILKDQIRSIEQWIGEQQKNLAEEKERIDNAYEENRKNLLATGSFSEDEVKGHLINIRKKSDEKQAAFDDYAAMLARCQNLYS